MRKVRFVLLALLLTAPVSVAPVLPHAARRTARKVTKAQTDASQAAAAATSYHKEFDAVWKTVHDRFYDEKLRGLDWSAVGERYRARLSEARDDRAFAALVNAMLGELNASHTRLFTPDDFEFYLLPALFGDDREPNRLTTRRRPALRHIGAMTRADQPGIMAAVLDGSPADVTGLEPGDVLVSVDGEPYRGLTQFAGSEPVTIVYRRGDQARTARISPVSEGPLDALLKATRKSATLLPLPDGRRVGYIRLWTMADPRFARELENTVRGKLHDSDGLILDIRDGFGGSPEGYADVFYRPDFTGWRRGRSGKNGESYATGYGKPLVALTNRGTRSAKEMLAWTLQRSRRATLIGQRTAGAVLASQGLPIRARASEPIRFYLSLAVTDLTMEGERLEGRGVAPDVPVPAGADEAAWRREAIRVLTAKLPTPSQRARGK